jgi:hypothetical protein
MAAFGAVLTRLLHAAAGTNSATLAGVSLTIPGGGFSVRHLSEGAAMSLDVKRDEFLRHLARLPHEGLRHWSRINENERIVVVTYMAAYYDIEFSKRFLTTARTGQRPDLTIYVTNDSSVTPEKLKQAGYRLLQTQGVLTMWVNPMGRQCGCCRRPRPCRHRRLRLEGRMVRFASILMSRKRACTPTIQVGAG